MRNHTLILFLIFILSQKAYGWDKTKVTTQAKLLTELMLERHYKPIPLDDTFGDLVNTSILEQLDPYYLFFTSQDKLTLKNYAKNIDEDVKNKEVTYLQKLSELFYIRLGKVEEIMQPFFNKPISLNSKNQYTTANFYYHWDEKRYTEKWSSYLHIQILYEMKEKLSTKNYQYSKDSLVYIEKDARENIKKTYVEYLKILKNNDEDFLPEIYLNAIALAFDPHSGFISTSSKREFDEELSSERELYGISFQKNMYNEIVITQVVPGSPAWLSNEVHEGDIIQKIKFSNGETFNSSSQSLYDLNKMLKENPSKTIDITLKKIDGTKKINLTKAFVQTDDDIIKNAIITSTSKIGYISLPDFYMNWSDTSQLGCANDMAKTIVKLKKDNIQGLIIDLRGNGGGSLKEAIDLAGIFIDYGPILMVKNSENEVLTLKDFNRGYIYSGPLIILIDEGSASASEVLASTLQDYQKAIIVGSKSFGKATAQLDIPLNENDMDMGYGKVTIEGLYRINGQWNQSKGMNPDVSFQFSTNENYQTEKDYQNSIQLDSISKRPSYTTSNSYNIEDLQTKSKSRYHTDEYSNYIKLLSEIEKMILADTILFCNFDQFLQNEIKKQTAYNAFENYTMSTNISFTSNSFDYKVYKINSYLNKYNESFLSKLTKDIELYEAVQIMNDMIDQKK